MNLQTGNKNNLNTFDKKKNKHVSDILQIYPEMSDTVIYIHGK
jgi:hypothetical protein